LRELLDTVLAPAHEHQKLNFDGPDVEVPNAKLTSVALILHEWATNASKYGALGDENGSVTVNWDFDGNDLRLDWIENGISASPARWQVPSASITAMPKRAGSTQASGGI